jgi:D-amino peptidase
MKIFISADIEGTTGIASWDEADHNKEGYRYFAARMTQEVRAACLGANAAGATDIVIKDAHSTARNIIPDALPHNVRLIRGWSGHPYKMMQEIDDTVDAAIFIGYHAAAGTATHPLAHTISSAAIDYIDINGRLASEFLINAYTAALHEVPVVLVSGDAGLMQEVKALNSHIATVPVAQGIGNATVAIHPAIACEQIQQTVTDALTGDMQQCRLTLPDTFRVEIGYRDHARAYRAAFYPSVSPKSAKSVVFESQDYLEVLRAFLFLI